MEKRQNKPKAQIEAEIKHQEKIKRQKSLAHSVFPAVEQLATVYDAQTVFNAVAGHLKYGLILKENELKVSDLSIDLEKGKPSPVKHAVETIVGLLKTENAKESMELLELMGAKLPEFLANKGLTGSMSQVTAEEFISK